MNDKTKLFGAVTLFVFICCLAVALAVGFFNTVLSASYTQETNDKYEYGLRLDVDNQVVYNQVFYDLPIGIVVWSNNNTVDGCTFINCSDEGIVLFGGNNKIVDCVFVGCADGVELQNSLNNRFENCRFINNIHAGVDGIQNNNNDNLFINCLFYNNFMGVYFKGSNGNQFVDCCFLNNEFDEVKI